MLHATCDVGDVVESVLEHPFSSPCATHADGAVDEVFEVFGKVGGGGGPTGEREELAAVDVGCEVFILFANIEKDAIEAVGEDLTELKSGDFREWGHFFFMGERFADGGLTAAKGATGIAFDFNFTEGR